MPASLGPAPAPLLTTAFLMAYRKASVGMLTHVMFRKTLPGLVLVGLVSLCGCSSGPEVPPMAKVSGKITRKGKALTPVTVAFTAISGGIPPAYRYASAKTDAEGQYAIEKVAEAEYMVSLFEEAPAPNPAEGGKVLANVGTPQMVKYGSNSALRAPVKAPATEFSYDVKE